MKNYGKRYKYNTAGYRPKYDPGELQAAAEMSRLNGHQQIT